MEALEMGLKMALITTITNGMPDVHVSKTAGARRKDEYDVDFE
jgi:hypothetical protein